MLTAAHIAEDMDATAQYAARQDLQKSIEADRLAHKILDEILAFIRPGMRESEVKDYAYKCYEAHAVERPWHMPYIRFGEHTLLIYKGKAKEDRVLGETDIAFADIGVVKNGVEGDAGRTVAFGSDAMLHKLAAASKTIFDEMTEYWRRNDPTGQEFHPVICDAAKKHGFAFNLDPAGHLIGTFPHKGWKRGMNNFPAKLQKGLWILEIQLRHPELPYGAFYEALLH